METAKMQKMLNTMMKFRLTQALSELQALDAEMSQPDFTLGKPSDYGPEARRFISDTISDIREHAMDLLNKVKEEANG